MAAQVLLHLAAFTLFVIGANAWRCAKYQHYFSQQPDYIECLWDCCGNSFNRHCCAPIGIIVGCCIVGAVVVAALTVVMICWWQRRRARHSKGPRLFHNRRHSHYPVAPTSVTRPAPMYPGGPDSGYKPPPPGPGYGPGEPGYGPRGPGYGPPPRGPPQDYKPPPRSEKPPPPDDYYDDMPSQGYRLGPRQASGPYRDDPEKPYRGGPEKVRLDDLSGERAVDI